MGTNTIVGIVIVAIMVIIGFSLWPILNGASNNLFQYFQNSCESTSGERFTRGFAEITGQAMVPLNDEYNTTTGRFGGNGGKVSLKSGTTGTCMLEALTVSGADGSVNLVNEYGESIGSGTISSKATAAVDLSTDDYSWIKVPRMLQRFSSVNNVLLTITPVITVVVFLGVSGVSLWRARSRGELGAAVNKSVIVLVALIVLMSISGPVIGQAVFANTTVETGRYEINGQFGGIIELLFAMFPIVYIAGILTVLGMHAREVFTGSKSTSGSMA